MENFDFLFPTKIIFGKGTEERVGSEVAQFGSKVLIHYGKGSVKKSGLLEKIQASLTAAGIPYVELGGVEANPKLELVYEGIELARKSGVDLVLAVGGGSVIDSSKAIAMGVPYSGDVWDFYTKGVEPKTVLPVCTVLTIPAAGSEGSTDSVITKADEKLKRFVGSEKLRPKFSILNPELTYTLPPYQTACGATDIMAHMMERYFTPVRHVELTDRLCEAGIKTVIDNAPIVIADPTNYDARAEIMWAGTLAHNNLMSTGRIGDFASHMIEHELSGFNEVAHGAGLAVVIPAWMKYVYKNDPERFAVRVFNVEQDFYDSEVTILRGIERLENFYRSIGMPTRLSEIGIKEADLSAIAEKCWKDEDGSIGHLTKLYEEDIVNILKLAL